MARETPTKRNLSIYLIKAGLKRPEEILAEVGHCKSHEVTLGPGQKATLYTKAVIPHPPDWVSLFEGRCVPRVAGLVAASTAGILLVPRKKRIFAISFGYGRHLLAPWAFEENFGLHVTLNSVDGKTLRTIDRDSLEAVARHTREQASRATSIEGFEINIEQDVLRAVTGVPTDKSLGDLLSGREGLAARVHMALESLPDLLDRYLSASFGETYKKTFPWVDHIREVRDPEVKEGLDRTLLDRIENRALEGIWLTVPEVIDWSAIKGLRYGRSRNALLHPDLNLRDYLDGFEDESLLTLEKLKRDVAQAIATDSEEAAHSWSLYRCLYAELAASGKVHLLNNGVWYQIEQDYADEVTAVVARIPRCSMTFPAYTGPDEGQYNEAVANASPDVALIDKKLISYGGGHSKVEPCDLYCRDGRFVHAKRFGGSSSLSHLFSQGVVAGNTFFRSAPFRHEFNKRLPSDMRLPRPDDRVDASRHEVAYGIISRNMTARTIPFFSKVTLRKAFEDLEGLGYRVSVAFIPDATQQPGGKPKGARKPARKK